MHGLYWLELQNVGMKNLSGCDSPGRIVIGAASNEHISVGQQRGAWLAASAGHLCDHHKFPCRGIVQFG
jgi:hypothetical protein